MARNRHYPSSFKINEVEMNITKNLALMAMLSLSALASQAQALTLGVDGQIFYSGGTLAVQNLPASSGASNYKIGRAHV